MKQLHLEILSMAKLSYKIHYFDQFETKQMNISPNDLQRFIVSL